MERNGKLYVKRKRGKIRVCTLGEGGDDILHLLYTEIRTISWARESHFHLDPCKRQIDKEACEDQGNRGSWRIRRRRGKLQTDKKSSGSACKKVKGGECVVQ